VSDPTDDDPGGAATDDEESAAEVVEETRRAASDARETVAREYPVDRDWHEPAATRGKVVARRLAPVAALVAVGWLLRVFLRRRKRTKQG
jgi:hypothetical protein